MKSEKRTDSKMRWLKRIGWCLIVTSVILICIFLVKGETTIDEPGSHVFASLSLSCERAGQNYPFFTFDSALSKNTKIDILFSDKSVKVYALKHTLFYDDLALVQQSLDVNHANLNIDFQNSGLGPDALGANFSHQSDKIILSLFMYDYEFRADGLKYFMLDENGERKNIDDFILEYEKQGFVCEKN